MKNLNEYIKVQRNLKNLTQSELAEFAEVNVNTIVKIEKDENKATVETLRKVLDVLDLELVVVPKKNTKTQFMEEYYPHLKESGISQYILRIIAEIERHRAIFGTSRNKEVVKLKFEKLITRLYDPKMKTEEGQKIFYRALDILPEITEKMNGQHILFWRVKSVSAEDDYLVFDCKNNSHSGFKTHPYPLPLSVNRESKKTAESVIDFFKSLHSVEIINLKDILFIEDENERKEKLMDFLKNHKLEEDACQYMVNNLSAEDLKNCF